MDSSWSVVLPFYNEAAFLPDTLASLAAQTLRPLRLVLVDNGSTDGSAEIARAAMAAHPDIDTAILQDLRPGKINALETGLAAVTSGFVAFCDADTWYPPHYLQLCDRQFRAGGARVVAVMALGLHGTPHSARSRVRRQIYPRVIARVLQQQVHTGGYGQAFRTRALRAAGGYCVDRWSHVLEDHEIMQRVFRHGHARYHPDLWCLTSNRRSDRMGWTLPERLLYHATPYAAKDWFFYRFLGPRFAARRLDAAALRTHRNWEVA